MKKSIPATAAALLFAALLSAQTPPAAAPAPIAPDSTAVTAPVDAPPLIIDTVKAAPEQKPEKKTIVRTKNKDEETEVITTYKGSVNELRSPKKAFFLSFILPGLGEYYAKAGWARISIPAAIEVASYVSIYLIRQQYDDKVLVYKNWADAHFSYGKFIAFYNYIHNSPDTIVNWEHDAFSHPPDSIVVGDNNYYEMVAKYDEFTQGWDDVTPDMVNPHPAQTDSFWYVQAQAFGSDHDYRYRGFAIDHLVRDNGGNVVDTAWLYYHDSPANKRPRYFGYSPNQMHMMDLRDEANTVGDKVMIVFYAMLVNRMASAVDAVLAANAFNRRITGNTTTQLDHFRVYPARVGTTDRVSNGAIIAYQF